MTKTMIHPDDTIFREVFDEALTVAKVAIELEQTLHGPEHDRDPCGFAWVTVRPAKVRFIKWCQRQKSLAEAKGDRDAARAYGSKGWNGGWEFWNPGGYVGQSIRIKEAASAAFRNYIAMQLGLSAEAGSRLD